MKRIYKKARRVYADGYNPKIKYWAEQWLKYEAEDDKEDTVMAQQKLQYFIMKEQNLLMDEKTEKITSKF